MSNFFQFRQLKKKHIFRETTDITTFEPPLILSGDLDDFLWGDGPPFSNIELRSCRDLNHYFLFEKGVSFG